MNIAVLDNAFNVCSHTDVENVRVAKKDSQVTTVSLMITHVLDRKIFYALGMVNATERNANVNHIGVG